MAPSSKGVCASNPSARAWSMQWASLLLREGRGQNATPGSLLSSSGGRLSVPGMKKESRRATQKGAAKLWRHRWAGARGPRFVPPRPRPLSSCSPCPHAALPVLHAAPGPPRCLQRHRWGGAGQRECCPGPAAPPRHPHGPCSRSSGAVKLFLPLYLIMLLSAHNHLSLTTKL